MNIVGVVTAIVAVVSAIVTVVALHFTRQQVALAKRQTELQEKSREDATQPYVWIDIRPSDRDGFLLLLVVRNEGPTVATDVEVLFEPPLQPQWGRSDRSAESRDRVRLASMPPTREVRWYVGTGLAWFEDNGPKRFSVTIHAQGPFGAVPPIEYVLDIEDFRDTAIQPPGTLHGVTEAINALAKETKAIARTNQRRASS